MIPSDRSAILRALVATFLLWLLYLFLSFALSRLWGGGGISPLAAAAIGGVVVYLAVVEVKVSSRELSEGGRSVVLQILKAAKRGVSGDEIRDVYDARDELRKILDKAGDTEAVEHALELLLSEGVIVFSTDGKVIRINGAAKEILEFSGQEVEGRSIEEVLRSYELQKFVEDISRNEKAIDLRALKLSSLKGLRDCRVELSRSGSRIVVANGIKFLRSVSDSAVLLILRDITEIERLEAIRRDFVRNVSHEIRTPLTAIGGSVETLKEGAINNPEDAQKFLGIIDRHTARVEQIVNGLLDLARLEEVRGENVLHSESISGQSLVCAAVEACSDYAKKEGIRIEQEFASGNVDVSVNRPLFEQALINLLDNAIKYSKEGSSASIRVLRDGGYVRFDVADHGRGIPEEHLSRIFERFYRVDSSRIRDGAHLREMKGAGLGLSIVKHVARVHGGEVRAESEVNIGSTFSLFIPASRTE